MRHQRVDVKRETVELKQGGAWYAIPGGGFIRGYGGVPGSLSLTFSMYSGGDLNNEEGWNVDVTGTPVGDSVVSSISKTDKAGVGEPGQTSAFPLR